MPKSKLELYEDVLAALVNKPLTVDAIAYTCGMDCIILRQRLDFLMKNGLVEERSGQESQLRPDKQGLSHFQNPRHHKAPEKTANQHPNDR